MPEILITQDDIEVTKDTQLNIFNNEKFNGENYPQYQGVLNLHIKYLGCCIMVIGSLLILNTCLSRTIIVPMRRFLFCVR